ncbi:MAG: VWA domain-containing protein [Myxococcales bacterium]|nr:VWA domain-containing protein [Myxococcales bacterium]
MRAPHRAAVTAFVCLAAAQAWAAPVRPTVAIPQETVEADRAQTIEILVRLAADAARPVPPSERPPLNLALVIDRSGSMAEIGKLTHAREAAKRVVRALTPRDRISVVEYDDRVTVLWPGGPATAPEAVARAIDTLTPRGNTNLAGGMRRGIEEVLAGWSPRAIHRVLLLTDGLANEGVTAPDAIARLAGAGRERGARVTTMGLGAHYDEDLLARVAEAGGGRYYFIESPEQMARIFEEEIHGMRATVARNLILRFDGDACVRDVEILGYPSQTRGARTEAPMEDLPAGEDRSMLLRLRTRAVPAGPVRLGTVSLGYDDALTGERVTWREVVTVAASADPARRAASVNKDAAAEAVLIDADARHRKALESFAAGRADEAQAAIETLRGEVAERNAALGDVALSKKAEALSLEAESLPAAAAATAEDRSVYLKKGKQRAAEGVKGRRDLYLLEPGASGAQVERLQGALRDRGIYQGPADGDYDEDVAQAVRRLQEREHLEADGVAGPRTLKALGLY